MLSLAITTHMCDVGQAIPMYVDEPSSRRHILTTILPAMLSLVVLLSVRAGTLRVLLAARKVRECCNYLQQKCLNRPVASVIWTKENPTPWNTIQPDQNTKLLQVNPKLEKKCVLLPVVVFTNLSSMSSWSRDKL